MIRVHVDIQSGCTWDCALRFVIVRTKIDNERTLYQVCVSVRANLLNLCCSGIFSQLGVDSGRSRAR